MRNLGLSLSVVILFLVSALLPPAWAQVKARSLSGAESPTTILATAGRTTVTAQPAPTANAAEQLGRQAYEAGQYATAIAHWETALAAMAAEPASLVQVMLLSNLSLAHQYLGEWDNAQDRIQAALTRLAQVPETTGRSLVEAQILDVLGRLQLERGQAAAALQTWQRAAAVYPATATLRLTQNAINQARALQILGQYPQARRTLETAQEALAQQPDSPLKGEALQALGKVLRRTADRETATAVLTEALTLAENRGDEAAIAALHISLGDTAQAAGDWETALDYYQAAATVTTPLTQVTAQLRQLALHLDRGAAGIAQTLWPVIPPLLEALPPGRPSVSARLELGRSLIDLVSRDPTVTIPAAQLLVEAVQQAQALADPRLESQALGTLGELYLATQQPAAAAALLQPALTLAESIAAGDLSYRWQWQWGRLLVAQGDRAGAIAAYRQAVDTLETLRRDLLALNPDVQFSFREDVEPVYRELVDLLLQTGQAGAAQTVQADLAQQADLRLARNTIEQLQIAELDNFFREACLVPLQDLDQVVEQAADRTAVLYTILLPDRLEIVLKLPQQPLSHRATPVAQAEVEQTLRALQAGLRSPLNLSETQRLAQLVYTWLIEPIAPELATNNIDTLVFVLDGALRSIPMAALYDGNAYLVEQFAIALAPGLQLTNPQALTEVDVVALAAGLTAARQGFIPLPHVQAELTQLQATVKSEILLDDQFTATTLERQVNASDFAVLHLATHGEFSSQADETFILAWDRKIPVQELDTVLRDRDLTQPNPLELLVLSACETATGDLRAALGLAGVAVRAGARSTLASLWTIPDESTAMLMSEFYKALVTPGMSRAEALRQAQLAVLRSPNFQRPRHWAPFVLLGSWL